MVGMVVPVNSSTILAVPGFSGIQLPTAFDSAGNPGQSDTGAPEPTRYFYFNAPLNAAAGNTVLYKVQQVVSQGKRGQKLHPVKVKSAALGALGESIMLIMGSHRTNQPLQLKVTGLTGENGASGAAFETKL